MPSFLFPCNVHGNIGQQAIRLTDSGFWFYPRPTMLLHISQSPIYNLTDIK